MDRPEDLLGLGMFQARGAEIGPDPDLASG